MRPLRIVLVVVLAALIIGVFVWRSYQEGYVVTDQMSGPIGIASSSPRNQPPSASTAEALAAFPLNSPRTDARADVRLVLDTIDTFRSNFPQDGNPVGSNAEITAALTGKNKARFAFVPPQHPAINGDGELCDRWGTPFSFHAESGTRMEVRSAGPDRRLHTDDDIVLSP